VDIVICCRGKSRRPRLEALDTMREERVCGLFMCFLEGHGLRRREESATFLRCWFLLSFWYWFSVKVNTSKGGPLPLLLYHGLVFGERNQPPN
jgi:hypothetical protein